MPEDFEDDEGMPVELKVTYGELSFGVKATITVSFVVALVLAVAKLLGY